MNVYERAEEYREKNNCSVQDAIKAIGCTTSGYFSGKRRALEGKKKKVVRIVDPAVKSQPSLADSIAQVESGLKNIKRILGL